MSTYAKLKGGGMGDPSKTSIQFAVFGFAFGLLFPLAGTLLHALGHDGGLTFSNIILSQQGSELLWIIDTAPFWLGLFAYWSGRRQGRLNEYAQHLEEMVEIRISQADQLNRRLEQEVAQLTQTQHRLRAAKSAAEVANQVKDEFIANISHELRTPMNAIVGLSKVVLEAGIGAEEKDMMEIVVESSNNLLFLINNILDFSDIKQEAFDVEEAEFHLDEELAYIASSFQNRFEQKGIHLLTNISPAIPHTIWGAHLCIRQILINLIGNALNFTEAGNASINVDLLEGEESKFTLLFSISDTGLGIQEEHKQLIYESFQQVDGSSTRKVGGLGLGLTLTKSLVELQGGEISFVSHPGDGTTFYFSVPCQEVQGKENHWKTDSLPELQGCRLLFVEDNHTNQKLMQKILQGSSMDLTIANHGAEAIELLKTENYDLVLMDVNMPVMDGLEASRRIRANQDGVQNPNIPIFAVTAMTKPEDRDQCMAAGMNEFIEKPLRKSLLLQRIGQYLQSS